MACHQNFEHWFTWPNHVILSSLKVSGTQPILMHNSTLYSRKNHSTEFHTFNEEQGKYIKAQNCTSYRPLFFTFVYFQVILILSMDSITVVVWWCRMHSVTHYPHNCKKCHCTDIKKRDYSKWPDTKHCKMTRITKIMKSNYQNRIWKSRLSNLSHYMEYDEIQCSAITTTVFGFTSCYPFILLQFPTVCDRVCKMRRSIRTVLTSFWAMPFLQSAKVGWFTRDLSSVKDKF